MEINRNGNISTDFNYTPAMHVAAVACLPALDGPSGRAGRATAGGAADFGSAAADSAE
jgi:hypothetical protein